MIDKSKCELCDQPLDQYAIQNESGYCTLCTHPNNTFVEVCNYFRIHLQSVPFRTKLGRDNDFSTFSSDKDSFIEVLWPDAKDPALYHKQACEHFDNWNEIVQSWKELRDIKYFTLEEFLSLIEFIKDTGKEKTFEEVCITRRDVVLNRINFAIEQKALAESENLAHNEQAVIQGAALPFLGYRTS